MKRRAIQIAATKLARALTRASRKQVWVDAGPQGQWVDKDPRKVRRARIVLSRRADVAARRPVQVRMLSAIYGLAG